MIPEGDDGLFDPELGERYRFRKAIAKAVIGISERVPEFHPEQIAIRLRDIYRNPSSDLSMRVMVQLFCNLAVPVADTLDCIEHALRSESAGVIKETGMGIAACASRIAGLWYSYHTDLLLTQLGKSPWEERAELARASVRLIESGYVPTLHHCKAMVVCLFDVNEWLGKFEAASRQLSVVRAATLAQNARKTDTTVRDSLFKSIADTLTHFSETEIKELAIFVGDVADKADLLAHDDDVDGPYLDVDSISEYLPRLFNLIVAKLETK